MVNGHEPAPLTDFSGVAFGDDLQLTEGRLPFHYRQLSGRIDKPFAVLLNTLNLIYGNGLVVAIVIRENHDGLVLGGVAPVRNRRFSLRRFSNLSG